MTSTVQSLRLNESDAPEKAVPPLHPSKNGGIGICFPRPPGRHREKSREHWREPAEKEFRLRQADEIESRQIKTRVGGGAGNPDKCNGEEGVALKRSGLAEDRE